MASTKRVLLVFGTRPEAIKMAPVYQALRAEPHRFAPICCVTAQHRGLLDQALASFGIVPDFDLDLMREGQQPAQVCAAVVAGLAPLLVKTAPDVVLVHGDTTTTAAAALAAFYAGIPVGHVEAGLRSGSLAAPFPEEMNRRVASLVARHHFAPTPDNRANLLREGCDPASIVVTGNTVVDALLATAARLDKDARFARTIARDLESDLGFSWRYEPFVLVTCHRREAFGAGLEAVCQAITELTERFPAERFVLPVHPNPAVADAMNARLGGRARVVLTPPLHYAAFVALLRACRLVLTDSGGVQEEAPSFGKPVLVMRELTERPEAVAARNARLVGLDPRAIVAAAEPILQAPPTGSAPAPSPNPFGDGRAASRIVEALR